MLKPLYNVGDEVYYLTFHGMRTAKITKVYRSRNTFAYDLETNELVSVGEARVKIHLSLEEDKLFSPLNA